MNNHKLVMIMAIGVVLVSLLAGCSSGITQEQYDSVRSQLADAQAQVAELQDEITDLEGQKEAAKSQLESAQAQVTGLTGEVSGLKEQYELVGDTPAETAENIVKRYHETHAYSKIDFYVCSDMSLDVWNMLKAQEINAVIQAGNVQREVAEITDSDHAWVLAEIAPGEYLALETTAGYVVPKAENALYYKGWSFASPKDFKDFSFLWKEYNIRVEIINHLAARINATAEEYNAAVDDWNDKYAGDSSSIGAQILDARMEEIQKKQELLTEIKREQEVLATKTLADAEALATRVNY